MANQRLTAIQVKNITEHGRHADGDGLYLVVDKHGKRWVYLYSLNKRRREMGLGSVSLAKAREKHKAARALVEDGIDPIDHRAAQQPGVVTFAHAADALIEDRKSGWVGKYTEASWKRSLVKYSARLRARPVADIDTPAVLEILRPMWTRMPVSARKLRERVEMTLDYAKVQGWRSGENPARWKGHLALILPEQPKMVRGHHAALPYADAPAFMTRLRARRAMSARALEFIILTAARENMVLGARWEEVDGDVWTIPKDRMKGTIKSRRAHRVPLSTQALALLAALPRVNDLIFPSAHKPRMDGQPVMMSNTAPDNLLQKVAPGMTTHGFRSTFSDWVGEETDHARETKEAALSHRIGDEAERAYRRMDALAKRRRLMQDWADYLDGVTPPADD